VARHWTDAYYGALYLESVEDLLTPALSALEADAIAALLALGPRDQVLDLACGHGRHVIHLAAKVERIIGLDRSAAYLRRAVAATATTTTTANSTEHSRSRARVPVYVRGDVRALPFPDGTFDAVFSWYASLFMFDDPTNEACLAEAGRVVLTRPPQGCGRWPRPGRRGRRPVRTDRAVRRAARGRA
jgi:ubiquinone/menaquinone biosynthesis C-methylase UbiE